MRVWLVSNIGLNLVIWWPAKDHESIGGIFHNKTMKRNMLSQKKPDWSRNHRVSRFSRYFPTKLEDQSWPAATRRTVTAATTGKSVSWADQLISAQLLTVLSDLPSCQRHFPWNEIASPLSWCSAGIHHFTCLANNRALTSDLLRAVSYCFESGSSLCCITQRLGACLLNQYCVIF